MTMEQAICVIQAARPMNGPNSKMINDALDFAIAALREQEERRWIPVTERFPDRNGEYICRHGYNGNTDIKFTGVLEYYATDEKPHWQYESIGLIVTHWMPLPEPPKEDE